MDLKRKKLEVELLRVNAGKAEMELRILQLTEEIKRIKENSIVAQDARIKEITDELKEG